MRSRNALAIPACLAFSLGAAFAQVADLSGGWTLNHAKSDFGKIRKPISVVVSIEHAEPALKYAGTIVYAHEDSREFSFQGAIDGKEYPSTYAAGAGKVAIRRLNPQTIEAVFRSQDGLVTETARTRVSRDGKFMTRRMRLEGPDGLSQWTEVYERRGR